MLSHHRKCSVNEDNNKTSLNLKTIFQICMILSSSVCNFFCSQVDLLCFQMLNANIYAVES